MKVYKEGDPSQPKFPTDYKVTKRWEGVCADVVKNSNKFYHAEIQVATNAARIFTTYGRVGSTAAREYRYYPNEYSCLNDYEALICKKRDRKKMPYVEVDLAITAVGSAGAKEIKKPMTGITVAVTENKSTLHIEVQRLVKKWYGDTGRFIEMTLKCPLGQLTKEQIDKGRAILDECKDRINSKLATNTTEFDKLTSQFYSLIPHVLPHKINAENLRLYTIDRIMEKNQTLDTFLDAKNVAGVLGSESAVDEKYAKLNATLEWINPKDEVYKWIEKLVHETRAKNHSGLGRIKIYNIFNLARNKESDYFNESLVRIAKEVGGKGEKPRFTSLVRPDLDDDTGKIFSLANVWPLWHGTRPENMTGIISTGLKIRPSGVVYCGSMYGDGAYFAENSTKSIGYCGAAGSVWSGRSSADRVYMFLNDVIVGNPYIVYASQFFRSPPNKCHSVYALPGRGLYNSENIIYVQSGPGQQHQLRYIIEFQSNQ